MRGGANGARLRLAPEKDWEVNNPAELSRVLPRLEAIQQEFNRSNAGRKVSLADLIVLGGTAAIDKAAKDAGYNVQVAFAPGRVDAKQDQTDTGSFSVLEPAADGFRNYYRQGLPLSPAEMLIDRAKMLNLSVPEMTVLIGGMRALNANAGGAPQGVFTNRPGVLTNDFFVTLLDMSIAWKKSSTDGLYDGVDRKTGQARWSATPVDLIFGSNSELRAVAEVYASDDAKGKFVQDFASAWTRVMNLDRFDLH
jgi:catalase-peroxidase